MKIPSDKCSGVDYVELVLGGPLWELYTELCEEMGAVLVMEDGAPTHQSKVAQDFCSTNSMEDLPHPPQSPDLNPIEHVWKRLKILVNEQPTHPRNTEDLWMALQEEWLKIDIDFINSLILSMPHCARAVYEARGRSTKY